MNPSVFMEGDCKGNKGGKEEKGKLRFSSEGENCAISFCTDVI
jgi:hypothetical protein